MNAVVDGLIAETREGFGLGPGNHLFAPGRNQSNEDAEEQSKEKQRRSEEAGPDPDAVAAGGAFVGGYRDCPFLLEALGSFLDEGVAEVAFGGAEVEDGRVVAVEDRLFGGGGGPVFRVEGFVAGCTCQVASFRKWSWTCQGWKGRMGGRFAAQRARRFSFKRSRRSGL